MGNLHRGLFPKLKEQARKQETKREGVVVSTLHGVKGLEYDSVYIMNVNEGSIPYKRQFLRKRLRKNGGFSMLG